MLNTTRLVFDKHICKISEIYFEGESKYILFSSCFIYQTDIGQRVTKNITILIYTLFLSHILFRVGKDISENSKPARIVTENILGLVP